MTSEAFSALMRQMINYEVVAVRATKSSLVLEGRIPGSSNQQWKVTREHLLVSADKAGIEFDLSQHWFVVPGRGAVWSWRFVLTGTPESIDERLDKIVQICRTAPKVMVTVTEFPLTGATSERNTPSQTATGFRRGATAVGFRAGGGGPRILR